MSWELVMKVSVLSRMGNSRTLPWNIAPWRRTVERRMVQRLVYSVLIYIENVRVGVFDDLARPNEWEWTGW